MSQESSAAEPQQTEPQCNGICVSAAEVGVPAAGIAYPHPTCPAHGWMPDHPFTAERDGSQICECGLGRREHYGEQNNETIEEHHEDRAER